MPAFLDTALVFIVAGSGRKTMRFLAMLGQGEYRIGVGEVDNGQRIGVGYVGSEWPFRDQPRGANVVVVVAEKADVDIEVVDKVG